MISQYYREHRVYLTTDTSDWISSSLDKSTSGVLKHHQAQMESTASPSPTDGQISRAQGCLFGQYIGDALGTRYEFKRRSVVRSMIAKDSKSGNFLPILAGNRFLLRGIPVVLTAGQVTDDTELAMALATSLLEEKRYDQASVASAYRQWLDSEPFDVGNTTANALSIPSSVQDKEEVLDTILEQARVENMGSLSNGCLMRISPLGIAGTFWESQELVKCSKLDAQLTNPHEDAQTAVACFTAAISELIRTGDTDKAYRSALEIAKESQLVTKFLLDAEESSPNVSLADGTPADQDGQHMGYLGVALQYAFHEMLHASSFEEGLVRKIMRGGDTDTNGCICGALLGARFGVELIPDEWKKTVMEAKQCREDVFPCVKSSGIGEVAVELLKVSACSS